MLKKISIYKLSMGIRPNANISKVAYCRLLEWLVCTMDGWL